MALKLAYLGLSLVMTLILFRIAFLAIDRTFKDVKKKNKKKAMVVIGLLLWHSYIAFTGSLDFFRDFSFPPRFVLFLIFPAFIFTGIFIYKNRNNQWIQEIPQSWLIFYQSFRIFIETIFVFSVAAGVLHYHVTIEGYNYDMVFAYLSIAVGLLVFVFKKLPLKFAYYWNFVGLFVILIIILIFQTTIYTPEIFGSEEVIVPKTFTEYPYVIVAGFLMPSAVFIHVLSIAQLKKHINN